MTKLIDLTGEVFGNLKVIRRAGSVNNRATWECVCKCGNSRVVCGRQLRNGSATDCGCSKNVEVEDGEEWKSIQGYVGMYEISSHGRVKSCKRYRAGKSGADTLVCERILRPSYDRYGYLKVSLRDGTKKDNHSVHQLVARAFIPNPNGYEQINHKDENKANNYVSNLEWCTAAYNNSYGTRLERIKETKRERVEGSEE